MQQSSRRAFLGSLGVAGLGVSAYVSPGRFGTAEDLSAAVPPGTWPTGGRTPQRTGYQPETAGPPEQHERVWQRDGINHGGTAVATKETLFLSGPTALSAADGSTRWEESLPEDHSRPGLGLWNGTLYADTSDRLYAVDTDSGSIEWARPDGDLEIAFVAGPTVVCRRDPGGAIGLDAETGATRWRVSEYDDPVLATGETIGFQTGGLYEPDITGIDPTTESVEWTVEWITDDPEEDIAVHDGVVYGSVDEFKAVEAATNATLWNEDFGREDGRSIPVATDGERLYTSGSGPGEVMGIEAATGELLWQLTDEEIGMGEKPVVTDDAVYVNTENGFVALDPATGRELNRFSLYEEGTGPPDGQLLVAGGQVYYVDILQVVAYR